MLTYKKSKTSFDCKSERSTSANVDFFLLCLKIVMIRLFFLSLAVGGLGLVAAAQNRSIDSLMTALHRNEVRDTTRVNLLNEIAFQYYYSSPTQTLNFAVEAQELSVQIGYAKGVATSYRHMGLAFWLQAMFSDALESFYKGLHIADSLGEETIKADIIGNIGLVQNGVSQYSEALKSFESSFQIHKELGNKARMAVMMNNIGDCYFNLRQFNDALKAYNSSLELGRPLGILVETNERNIGAVYEAFGDYSAAEQHYIASKKIADRRTQGREKALIRISLASLHLKKRELAKAEEMARDAIIVATQGNFRAQLRDSYLLLSQILHEKGQQKSALDAYKKGTIYKDSIQNLTEASRAAALQRNFELQLKQKEIDRLHKETVLRERELFKSKIAAVSASILLALLLIVVYVIVRSHRRQKATALLLKEQNAEISAQNDQLHEQQAELEAMSEDIARQSVEVSNQRDELAKKNKQIEALNIELSSLNRYLEDKVDDRTKELVRKNKALLDYAFFNAHKLRAPIARMLGLLSIMKFENTVTLRDDLLVYLQRSAVELEEVAKTKIPDNKKLH